MLDVITVSSRGQMVIPEKIRSQLGIIPGTKLVVFEKDGDIILKKEELVARRLLMDEKLETLGWLALAEKSLKEVWDNDKDEAWQKYL